VQSHAGSGSTGPQYRGLHQYNASVTVWRPWRFP